MSSLDLDICASSCLHRCYCSHTLYVLGNKAEVFPLRGFQEATYISVEGHGEASDHVRMETRSLHDHLRFLCSSCHFHDFAFMKLVICTANALK